MAATKFKGGTIEVKGTKIIIEIDATQHGTM